MARFYIVDDGYEVTLTDSEAVAKAAAEDDGICAVIDTETNKDITVDVQILENTTYQV